MIKNSEIQRYDIDWKGKYLIYTTDDTDIEQFPNIKEYLENFYKKLVERAEVRDKLYPWYRLQRPRRRELWEAPEKIVVPFRAPENRFAYDDQQFFNDGGDIRVVVPKPECPVNVKYILACLNSKVLNFFYKFIGRPKGEMLEYFVEPLAKLPVHRINFSQEFEKKMHDNLVELVNKMILLKKHLKEIITDFDRYLTEPIMGYVNFKDYYKKLDVKDKEALDKTSTGIIKRVKVEEQDSWLIFKVNYFVKRDKTKEEFTDVPVLKCRFEDVYFRKFLLYIFQNYKKRWGSGNLLHVILKTPIPCFDKNPDKNKQVIEKIMKEFLKTVEEKERTEKEIEQTDKMIDSKVYELYGLTSEEISIIEDYLRRK
ncbi:MAG: TaqI-like C-terminal specificity domain-containing protein [Candidatus Bathyarchaeales archaeon]